MGKYPKLYYRVFNTPTDHTVQNMLWASIEGESDKLYQNMGRLTNKDGTPSRGFILWNNTTLHPRITQPGFEIKQSYMSEMFTITIGNSILETAYRVKPNKDRNIVTQGNVTHDYLVVAASGIFAGAKTVQVKFIGTGVYKRIITIK